MDFEKAFDSVPWEILWHILRAYGIPKQIVLVTKSFYNNFKCRVGNSESSFGVKTGVRQGCPMSYVALQPDDWLGDAANDIWPTMGHQMDPRLNPWSSVFRRWHSAGFTHSSAYARENHPSQDVCTTNRPEDQPEEDRNDDAECVKLLAGQRMEKSFQQLKTSVALCGLTAEQAATSGITSTRPGTPTECLTTCGGHPSTTPRPS